jgi:hypothetical protein
MCMMQESLISINASWMAANRIITLYEVLNFFEDWLSQYIEINLNILLENQGEKRSHFFATQPQSWEMDKLQPHHGWD